MIFGLEDPDALYEQTMEKLQSQHDSHTQALAVEQKEWRMMREVFWEQQQVVAALRRKIFQVRDTASGSLFNEALYRHSLAMTESDRTQERVVLKKKAVNSLVAEMKGIEKKILETRKERQEAIATAVFSRPEAKALPAHSDERAEHALEAAYRTLRTAELYSVWAQTQVRNMLADIVQVREMIVGMIDDNAKESAAEEKAGSELANFETAMIATSAKQGPGRTRSPSKMPALRGHKPGRH